MDKSTHMQACISTNKSMAFNIHSKQHYVMENQWIMRDEEKTAYIPGSSSKEIKSQLSQRVSLSKDSSSKAAHLKCLSLPSRTHYICLWKISALLFLCPPHDLCCSHLFSPICPLSTACGTPFQRNISNGLKILEYPLDRCLILIASSIPLFWSHIN